MKLIRLYIENFGGLSRYELDLEAGLTAVVEPNGFGKTTLAEFIRAMLYGFPRKNKTLDKSPRQKYTPWNGGQFGGNLIFEYEGCRYRVERTFGENPRTDTFALIDLETNKRSDRFTENLGWELFGLDADSFARSTYLPQAEEEGPLATASIQAKLTELVEDGSDVANFDRAVTALKAKRSALIPYRGNGGAVAETVGKITRTQLRLDEAVQRQERYLTLQSQITRAETELENTREELEVLRQQIVDAADAAENALRQEQYARLSSRCRQVAEREQHLQEMYPAGFPDLQELRRAETAAERLTVLGQQSVTTAADLQAQTALKEAGQLPDREQLHRCRMDCEHYDTLLLQIHEEEQTQAQQNKGAAMVAALLLTVGIAAAAGGVWLVTRSWIYGAGIAVAGMVAVLTGILLLCRRPRKKKHMETLAQLREELTLCAGKIENLLVPCVGVVEPKYYLSALTRLEHKLAACTQAQEQLQDWQRRKEAHSAEMETCRRELADFFTRYQLEMGDDPRGRLYQLRLDHHDARTLHAQKQQLEEELESFRKHYGQILGAEPVPTQDPAPLRAREQTLRADLTQRQNAQLDRKQQLQLLRYRPEEIGLLREELESQQQKLADDREAAQILDATIELLQQARENLSTAYLGTIRSRFAYYLSQLEAVSGESFFIDSDFQLQLERMGKARELAYFSAGQTDLLMLCMRLALVDALFKEQDVIVVLDDPFVNLDDVHTAQALKLLNQLSAHRQILYLTCHSSRTISK